MWILDKLLGQQAWSRATCLPQTAAATQCLQRLALADPQKAHRLSHHTSTYKQTRTINKKQYTNQSK